MITIKYTDDTRKRLLMLDAVTRRVENLVVLKKPEEIAELFERYFILESPPEITLDIRGLSARHVTSLLKFIEEYRGDLTLIANDDPVPKPILSRFYEIEKDPVYDEYYKDIRSLTVMNVLFLSKNMKKKVCGLLDLYYPEERQVEQYENEDGIITDYDQVELAGDFDFDD